MDDPISQLKPARRNFPIFPRQYGKWTLIHPFSNPAGFIREQTANLPIDDQIYEIMLSKFPIHRCEAYDDPTKLISSRLEPCQLITFPLRPIMRRQVTLALPNGNHKGKF
ncbi:hypothetical protein DSO57_1038964 [Entomophthora muscae]|uniref:Uncharacterized protein n=1 Tax=Entomophthora muscae TaxID=34485 RepID=A0ACC2U7Y5_9FUNG|nr:hypothetical protein DSO57_1038964 [Entomophthora muscae]